MSAPRFYSEGGGRIYDREWEHPGYVVKVWARLDNGASLTDAGPAVQKQTDSILALLNESATLRALYAEAVRALAANRAQATGTYSKKPCGHHFFCLCAAEASEAVISRPEAVAILKGESRG